ncbi:MAG: acyl-homoserine-lactone acylase, partial [Betaproteobacteria bacterium]|nr:acyl-homoserine-lactone acylase [Betaproteobacteria bacterium]
MRRSFGFVAIVVALIAAPGADAARYKVKVKRDAHGVPTITAKNFPSVAYGYAKTIAEDNVCVLADTYVTVRGERSRYFGGDAGYEFRGNGTKANNRNSDFFYKKIIAQRTIEKLRSQPPPLGPVPAIKRAVRGYVAGYNAFLRKGTITDPACKDAEWVKPISVIDVYRRFYQLALLASAGVSIDGIGGAAPVAGRAADSATATQRRTLDHLTPGSFDELMGGIGSNAIALGKAGTQSGNGMLLGNPHFPWDGSERFYQSHLVIPGKVNVQGGSLYGVPLVLIGNTRNMAWSHTVSTARRFTPYQVAPAPGDPHSYIVDGKVEAMTPTTVTIDVKQPDGSITQESRTLYDTRWGPMLTSILGLPIFPWTPVAAFSLGDANAANFRYLNHFFFTNQAQSVKQLDRIERKYEGIPWVNTIAADSTGTAYYADIGAMPNVSNEKIAACNVTVGTVVDAALRVQVLDGGRSACAWDTDPDAVAPGIFGPSHMPSLFRDDYVTNSNDSYWLSNPEQPLEGFSRVIGDERTARALRTRLGLRIVQQRLDGSDGLPGRGFTLKQL